MIKTRKLRWDESFLHLHKVWWVILPACSEGSSLPSPLMLIISPFASSFLARWLTIKKTSPELVVMWIWSFIAVKCGILKHLARRTFKPSECAPSTWHTFRHKVDCASEGHSSHFPPLRFGYCSADGIAWRYFVIENDEVEATATLPLSRLRHYASTKIQCHWKQIRFALTINLHADTWR